MKNVMGELGAKDREGGRPFFVDSGVVLKEALAPFELTGLNSRRFFKALAACCKVFDAELFVIF